MSDDGYTPIPFGPQQGGGGARRTRRVVSRRAATGAPRGTRASVELGVAAPAPPAGAPRSPETGGNGGEPPAVPTLPTSGGAGGGEQPPPKPRVRKLRLLAIVLGLGALAAVSTVFGMMMAVASDLPQLENRAQYKHEENSFLYDHSGKLIGILAPPTHTVVIQRLSDISPWMRKAVVAVEDKRFWSEPGVDIQGIGRALISDVTGGSHQGASIPPRRR